MGHWDDYYAARGAPSVPSQFCVFIANEFPQATTIVEAGCGNGRDSAAFASFGYDLIAFDGSREAIAACEARNLPNAQFLHGEAGSAETWQAIARAIPDEAAQLVIYARFFLHAIDEDTETAMLEQMRPLLDREGAHLCIECRTSRDLGGSKVTPDHYRRFIVPAQLHARLGRLGLEVVYAAEGYGMAKYKDDDAHVLRVICRAA